MGIRVNKVLGYGFLNIETNDDGLITDSRFNPDWALYHYETRDLSFEGYLDFARKEQEARPRRGDIHTYKSTSFRRDTPSLYDFVSYDSEGGDSSIMVLTPITGLEWVRRDDQIDYYDERARGFWELESHVEVLDTPLYPYDYYINNETGEHAPNDVRESIYMFRNAVLDLCKTGSMSNDEHRKLCDMRDFALSDLDCEIHWTEKWNVGIPEQIQDFCRYTKMFQNDKSIWKLLPMIYTYWS